MSLLIRYMVTVQKVIVVFCSLLIAVTFGVVVVLRYGFEANLFAYEEWMLVAAFLLYFIGGAQGSYDNTHIKADLINEWITSPNIRRAFNLFILGIEVAVGVVLSYWGYLMIAEELVVYPELSATPVYGIPLAVPRGAIFIGLVLMTFYSAMHFVLLWNRLPDAAFCDQAGDH